MSALGLDIGTYSIKFVESQPSGDTFRLLGFGSIPVPSKGIASDAAFDLQVLIAVIKKLLHDAGIKSKKVALSLPESKVFTRVIEVPRLSEKELANSLTWEAEQYIPLPLNEVEMDFTPLRPTVAVNGALRQEILLVAAPKQTIEKYDTIAQELGLEATSMETDLLCATRPFAVGHQQSSYILLLMGASSSSFMIFNKGLTVVSRSLEVAGNAFTRVIGQEFNFEPLQAEEYKKTYGLETDKVEGKVAKALLPIFNTIVEEIRRSIAFYYQKFPDDKLTSLVVVGGTAHLPGLITTLAGQLNIEVQIGDSWQQFVVDTKKFPQISEKAPQFAVAAGLAMRQ